MEFMLLRDQGQFVTAGDRRTSRGIVSQRVMAWLALCCLALLLQGCASVAKSGWVKKQVGKGVYPTLETFHDVAMGCQDMEIVKTTMEAYVLLAETLAVSSPENQDLAVFASRIYAYLSFGFVVHEDLERARKLYWKGIELGKKALRLNPDLKEALDRGEPLYRNVHLLRPEKDVPAAFATALNQGMLLICSLDVPEAVGEANAFKALCDWVIEHDPTYFCGGTYSLIGVFYGLKPGIMGGGPEKARKEFDEAIRINPDFLLHHYLFARYVPTLIHDEPLFDKTLQFVREADSMAVPEFAALNEVAKLKARLLDENRDLYF